MPKITCQATSCVYNNGGLCFLAPVRVTGSSAVTSQQTCCESFVAGSHSTGSPRAHNPISCAALSCYYNQSGACNADRVCITGRGAATSAQTECQTFKM